MRSRTQAEAAGRVAASAQGQGVESRSRGSGLSRVASLALYAAIIHYLGTVPYVKISRVSRVATLTVYTAIVQYLGTTRIAPPTVPGVAYQDKILHAIAFGGLAVLAYRCLAHFWPGKGALWTLGLATGFSTVVGAELELVQAMLPYRAMEFGDLVADAIGAALCALLARRLHLERNLFGLPL